MTEGVLNRLVAKYRELEELCYRLAVAVRDSRGRFRRGRRTPRTPAALLKKVDLDRALVRVYARFFGDDETGPSDPGCE